MNTPSPRPQVSPLAKAGLVFPGLGHLLTGQPIFGVGMMVLTGFWLWTLVAGIPRVGTVTGLTENELSIHGLVALASWLSLTALLWLTAWRLVKPAPVPPGAADTLSALIKREFLRNRNGMLGAAGVTWLVAATLLAPMLAPYDPDALIADKLLSPSWLHPMGTDEFGRDMLSRVLMGARVSMAIGFVAVGLAASIGTSLGAAAGYYGGRIDRSVMWLVDFLLSVPRLVLLLAIVGLFRPPGVYAIFLIVTILGLTGWMGVSRIVRSQVLSLKEQDFVQAARAMGLPDQRIIFRHLIPNAFAPVIVYCSLAIGATMLTEAGLSFLGLGVQPPTSTWGTLIADGRHKLQLAPWIAVFPGLAIVFAVMSFNLLGDGLRDALDPKQRGS